MGLLYIRSDGIFMIQWCLTAEDWDERADIFFRGNPVISCSYNNYDV